MRRRGRVSEMTLRCGWRRSFRSAKTGEVSKSYWNGPPVDVPQTPDVFARVPTTPRTTSSTRQHETEPDDHDSKRARVETAKKQRLERISSEYETMVRTVKFADESFHHG